MRELPYGSEGVTSPTYSGPTRGANAPTESTPRTTTIQEPSYHGPSAAWEKDETFPIHETPVPPSEEEKDVLET
jgi:glycogenin glucosyltransferase